jgi:hypothetical protein
MKTREKPPTQKHVCHTLRLLTQQECAFLERSVTHAENETTEPAKRDKNNKQLISIDNNNQILNQKLEWTQKAMNASYHITDSIYRAYKVAKTAITKTKTVSFATTRQVQIIQAKEVAAVITCDSSMDGHYLSERNCKSIGLPILRPSTKQVGVTNGGTSTARHVSHLLFQQLSDWAVSTDSFDNFPSLLMSVGKTSDDGTISIFTKDGITVHKEQDILITCKSEPILIDIRDDKGCYRIPLVQQRDNW